MKNNFPARLKKARLSKNLSQAKLGDLAHLKATIICTYETGRRSPTLATVKELATILEVSIGWLVGEPEKNIKNIKINPNEMILDLRDRIADSKEYIESLKDNVLTKNSLIQSLRDQNTQLKKDISMNKGDILRKNVS